MKLIIAIIKPDRLEAVKQELYKADVNLLTVNEVLGHGRQMGVTEVYRGVREMVTFSGKYAWRLLSMKTSWNPQSKPS